MFARCVVIKYVYKSTRDDYLTPSKFYENLMEKEDLGIFDCDVCCSIFNVPALFHYKKDGLYNLESKKISDKNGLGGDWFKYNWCNPPFGACIDFVKKAVHEQKRGNTTFMLMPARVETKYWHDYILDANGGTNRAGVEVRFLRKGLRFINPDNGEKLGIYKNALALVIFRGCTDA